MNTLTKNDAASERYPERTSEPPGSPWLWTPLGLLIACHLSIISTDSPGEHHLDFTCLLPVLTGWLASKYGPKVRGPLLVFGGLTLFGGNYISLDRVFDFPLRLDIGFSETSYAAAVATALALAEPSLIRNPADMLRSWWRPVLWTTIVAVLAAYSESGSLASHDYSISADWCAGAIPLLLGIALTVRWRQAGAAYWAPKKAGERALLAVMGLLFASAVFVRVSYSHGFSAPGLHFGWAYAWDILTVLCFVLVATETVDWRPLVGFSVAALLAYWLFVYIPASHHLVGKTSVSATSGEEQIPPYAWLPWDVSDAVSAALLGAVLARFWRRRDVATLRSWRTSVFLLAVLLTEFFVKPLLTHSHLIVDELETLILGGLAFVAGLTWRSRGLVAPLILQLSCLLSFALFNWDRDSAAWAPFLEIGATSFAFAFFGLLSTRYEGPREVVGKPKPSLTVGSQCGNRSIDITALSRVVGRLDVSATMKAFFMVLIPLFVITNTSLVLIFVRKVLLPDLPDSEEVPEWGAFLAVGVLFAIAPLGYFLADWLGRSAAGRYVAAITGAVLGAASFALGGALAGLVVMAMKEAEEGGSMGSARSGILIISAILLPTLTVWLLQRGRRSFILLGTSIALVIAFVVMALRQYGADLVEQAQEERPDFQKWQAVAVLIAYAVCLLLISGATIWWLLRSVRLRIVLSSDRPRALLLGDLCRPGFWVRLASLVGLPSSLWSAAALRTLPFWLFLCSRPLVYLGYMLLRTTSNLLLLLTAAIAVGLILIIAGHLAFFYGKRLAARRTWDPKDRSDPRRPILFLRSFEDDQFDFKRPKWQLVARWLDLWSFRRNADEVLIDEAAQYGPVVALRRPGEDKAPFGAARASAEGEDWKRIVTDAARRAQAIVIAAGDTKGVLWEYNLLASEGLLERTILLFRPTPAGDETNGRALAAFSAARATGTEQVPLGDGRLVALVQTREGHALLKTEKASGAAYVVALRAHFQECVSRDLMDPAL